MQLPAFSGKKKSINLLPKDAFESSGVGVVLSWALAFGKWAVIGTQLVVMSAFLWRFTLDRQLTNLRKDIAQEKAVIQSYEQIEAEFTATQQRVNFAQDSLTKQKGLKEGLTTLQALTPSDVWYDRVTISPETISFTAYSSSLNGFGRFLSAVQSRPEFSTVTVSSIDNGGSQGAQLRFDATLKRKGVKK